MTKMLWKLCLSPDGGGGMGGAAGGPAAGAEGGAQAGVKSEAPVAGEAKQRGRKGNALQNVVYGKDPQAMGQEGQEQAAAAQEPKGTEKGKSYTDADVQKIVGQRVGKLNQQLQTHQQTLNDQQPVIDLLMQRYGVKDAKGLMQALTDDEGLWQGEAARRGKSWEDVRDNAVQTSREAKLRARVEELENQQHAEQVMQRWSNEAEALKQTFPDFDLEKEFENEEFVGLLQSNVPMATAYKAVHMDEIMRNAISYTANTTRQQVADTVRARGMRPVENGMRSGAGVVAKPDVKSWSKQDRDEVERRAMRGEKIFL